MALLDSAVNGLAGALVSGAVAVGSFWWIGRRRRAQLEDAWHKQADELDERLSEQYRRQINWLQRQLAACQRECTRLNKLLNRRIE